MDGAAAASSGSTSLPFKLAREFGLEPKTSGFGDRRSSQLSYTRKGAGLPPAARMECHLQPICLASTDRPAKEDYRSAQRPPSGRPMHPSPCGGEITG